VSALPLDIAEVGESLGHIGAVWAVIELVLPLEEELLRRVLLAFDDEDRVRTVEQAQDLLVDIRDWATDLIAVFEEAGRE
jgi:hypothetical protein